MATWPPPADASADKAREQFSSALKSHAEANALRDGSSVVTDAHVNEAARAVMRGEIQDKSIGKRALLGSMDYGGGALGGCAFFIWGSNLGGGRQ